MQLHMQRRQHTFLTRPHGGVLGSNATPPLRPTSSAAKQRRRRQNPEKVGALDFPKKDRNMTCTGTGLSVSGSGRGSSSESNRETWAAQVTRQQQEMGANRTQQGDMRKQEAMMALRSIRFPLKALTGGPNWARSRRVKEVANKLAIPPNSLELKNREDEARKLLEGTKLLEQETK
uniref:Uncharacterized protein n=1 Tax=Oryza punctata TaxID=4537 RepID=A0A0E0LPW0_ORYPU